MKKIYRSICLCLYFVSSFTMACSCSYSTLAEKVAHSENIFIVETYEVETIEAADVDKFVSGTRRAYFKVLDTLKGSSSGLTYINSAEEPICCMCQSKVNNKTQYLVFNNGENEVYLNSCGFTRSISDSTETSEKISAMISIDKMTEIFTGIYISDKQVFLNDDGTKTKVLELQLDDYFTKMSRISFEGIRLPSGKVMVQRLQEERTLTEEEIKVVEEISNYRALSENQNNIIKSN